MKTCKSCWWQEGGKCYTDEGLVAGEANEVCARHWSKREALGQFTKGVELIIMSEGAEAAKEKTS
jgi:hypothetical protein